MERSRRRQQRRTGSGRPEISRWAPGLLLAFVLPALGVALHGADLVVSARVVRHTRVEVKPASATVRLSAEPAAPALSVESNGPTRRIEQVARPALVNGRTIPRRVVTVLTP